MERAEFSILKQRKRYYYARLNVRRGENENTVICSHSLRIRAVMRFNHRVEKALEEKYPPRCIEIFQRKWNFLWAEVPCPLSRSNRFVCGLAKESRF